MALFRTTAGLLFRDQFNRANGALGSGWVDNSNGKTVVEGNQARMKSQTLSDRAWQAAAGANGAVVQATRGRSSSWTDGIFGWWDPARNRGFGIMFNTEGSALAIYGYHLEPATVINSSPTTAINIAGAGSLSTINMKLRITDAVLSGNIPGFAVTLYINGTLRWSSANVVNPSAFGNLNGASGRAIICGRNSAGSSEHHYDDVCSYRSNSVTVTNLPSGWSARTGGVTASASAGTATIDAGGLSYPFTSVEVLDASAAVVQIITPSDGVWGGDAYRFNTAPAAPTATGVDTGSGYGNASLALSAVVDPDSGDTHTARIRVAAASAPGVLLYDSGWVAAPVAPVVVGGLPVAVELLVWGQYRDQYEDGAVGETSSFTLPEWRLCGTAPDSEWSGCGEGPATVWITC
jgi:hypothetical protein